MLSRDSEDDFDQDLCGTCVMTSISYFGKMNSTLGSVVPLAMFCTTPVHIISSLCEFCYDIHGSLILKNIGCLLNF